MRFRLSESALLKMCKRFLLFIMTSMDCLGECTARTLSSDPLFNEFMSLLVCLDLRFICQSARRCWDPLSLHRAYATSRWWRQPGIYDPTDSGHIPSIINIVVFYLLPSVQGRRWRYDITTTSANAAPL